MKIKTELVAFFFLSIVSANAFCEDIAKSSDVVPSKPVSTQTLAKNPPLWEIFKTLSSKKFVDLTHTFKPGIPRQKGFPEESLRALYDHKRDGFLVERYSLVGQWGTHADAPSHFHPDLRSLDEIPVREMIAPLVVIDIRERVKARPDAVVVMEDLRAWEEKHGKIPELAFVVLRTGWSRRWPDQAAMRNEDEKGIMHYPGWGLDALKFLVEERNITAIGHETGDTDPGVLVSKARYPAQTYIHAQDRYQVDYLTNVEKLPETGALVIISFPKPEASSGFPARAFAILP